MTLDNLVGKGLQREPAEPSEIQRLLAKADRRLTDAESGSISNDSRFDIAYEAVLQLSFCALRANGYRPDSRGGHHVLALQGLSKSVGYSAANVRLLDEFRRQRAIGLYDGSFDPTDSELESLIEEGRSLQSHLMSWLKAHHPQLVT
jgi:hypothetical protein